MVILPFFSHQSSKLTYQLLIFHLNIQESQFNIICSSFTSNKYNKQNRNRQFRTFLIKRFIICVNILFGLTVRDKLTFQYLYSWTVLKLYFTKILISRWHARQIMGFWQIYARNFSDGRTSDNLLNQHHLTVSQPQSDPKHWCPYNQILDVYQHFTDLRKALVISIHGQETRCITFVNFRYNL